MIRRLDQFSDENSSKYRNDGRERFRRTRTRLFLASFIPGNESAKPHRSIDRPSIEQWRDRRHRFRRRRRRRSTRIDASWIYSGLDRFRETPPYDRSSSDCRDL